MWKKITACLDMRGCPNRCRHCWLGATPNGSLNEADLRFAASAFRPFTNDLEVFDWYREPDYADNYRELWALTERLSDHKTPHFELISVWRAVRDAEYAPWLRSLGMRAAQLTLFGDEPTTDWFYGRRGAYGEVLKTMEILLANGIAPRIQTFVYKSNICQLPHILSLIEDMELEKRCAAMGSEFAFFLHQGTCDGENEAFYDSWITPTEMDLIPEKLKTMTLKHFHASDIHEVFGATERQLYEELKDDRSTKNIVEEEPVFFVDRSFDVYPNYETPSPFYRLGNLKTDGAERVLRAYCGHKSVAQRVWMTVPAAELAKKHGNPESERLFGKRDYLCLLHNRFCRETACKKSIGRTR